MLFLRCMFFVGVRFESFAAYTIKFKTSKNVYMKSYLIAITFTLLSATAIAQNLEIKGVVNEAGANLPLPGVNVLVKGTTNGTTTDFDGNFTLKNVKTGATLLFTYLGFKPIELQITDASFLTLEMEEDLQSLDEVVVVGFGSQAKKEITGAVSIISSEVIEDFKPVRVEQAIQGRNAGVQVISSSGAPGAGFRFNIRGISTNGDNNPLIVLDGNLFDGSLGDINPNDIESISVIKDASAAIYGVLSANGVILITTKGGQKNTAPKFEYNAYAGFQEVQRQLPVLNATEYALLINEARANGGETPLFTNVASLGEGTDFQEEIFEQAPIYSADFRVTGGGEKTTYGLSASYLTQDGIVGRNQASFDRITTRLNLNIDLSKNFTFNSNLFYTNTKSSGINENGLGSVIFNAVNNNPTQPVRDASGAFTLSEGTGNEVINPLAQLANTFNRSNNNSVGGIVGLKFKYDEHWSAETRLGLDYVVVDGFSFSPIAFFGAGKVFNQARSSVTENLDTFFDYNWDNFINYENIFAEKHKLKVTLGHQIIQNTGEFFNATGFDVPNNSIEFADLSLTNDNISDERFGNGQFRTRRASLFGRVQYDYLSKYLFTFTLRRDVSSFFGPENSAAYFPSGTAGWVVTEDFFKENEVLTFLKLRGSLGVLGSDRIPANGFRSLLDGEATAVFNGLLVNGDAIGRIPNPEIKWEQQTQFNVGADLRLWGKLGLTTDYFIRTTRDLLFVPPVSGTLGAAAPGGQPPIVNAGTVRNNGFEFTANYNDSFSEDFTFNVNYNFTVLNSEVLAVNNGTGFIPGGQFGVGQDPPSRFEEGFAPGYFLGLETDGIFQNQAEVAAAAVQQNAAPGEFRFVDQNNDGVIDESDRTDIGNPIPDVTMGLTIGFDYKGFDFNVYSFAQLGNEIVRNYERNQPLTNRRIGFLDRFTTEGSSNSFPRVTTGPTSTFLFSDFFVEDGSFARIQTIQLGYSLPKGIIEKLQLSRLRVYAQVNNVYTFTEYSGFDPTVASTGVIGGGIDFGAFPVPRTYLFGVNVNF